VFLTLVCVFLTAPFELSHGSLQGTAALIETASVTDERTIHDWEAGNGPVDSGRA